MSGALKIGPVTYPADAAAGEKLLRSSVYLSDSLVAESLGVDTITAVVQDQSTEVRPLAAGGHLLAAGGQLVAARAQAQPLDERAEYGDELDYTQDGKSVLKIYVESVERIGKSAYQVFGISAVGLLLTSDHYGGVYTGETVSQVIADVVGGIFPYTLDPVLGAAPLFGWLPKQSRRDALRDVLFAVGGQVRKDTAGAVVIVGQAAAAPYEITVDEFYMGGSVTGGNPATGVNLTEHTFMQTTNDATVTLFDGESAAEQLLTPKGATVTGVLVDFGEPMHDLNITNAEILESGANYAVISGSPEAVLTGRAYTHTQRIISRRRTTGGIPNIVTSSRCTLVNLMNSELVADRLMAYYGAAKTVTANIIATDQKPGDAVSFVDPFGDAREGYIQDMDITMSGIMAANTTIVSGFIPTASGNYYSHLAVLTVSGNWTVPAECKGKIRVVLIGGGQGGHGGTGGNGAVYALGQDPSVVDSDGVGADGGQPGVPGSGGKIFVSTMAAKPGQTFAFTIGAGGAGGIAGGGGARVAYDPRHVYDATAAIGNPGLPGEEGGATTFGSLSSANGKVVETGYIEITTGAIYATPGEDGVPGGKGGGTYGGAKPGEAVGEWAGGQPGEQILQYNVDSGGSEHNYIAQGGGGGGAAYGCAGYKGGDAEWASDMSAILTGAGGVGGNAIQAAAGTIYGSGGQGGHGGGGAGNPGGGEGTTMYVTNYGLGGAYGGAGGQGGNGAPGAILIYY